MSDWNLCNLPFFGPEHKQVESDLIRWREGFPAIEAEIAAMPLDDQCRTLLRHLGASGLLGYAVPPNVEVDRKIDVRSAALVREALGYDSVLCDFVFAMQAIGAAPLWLFGSPALKDRYLRGIRDGSRTAAFAMSEPEGGSDVSALTTRARLDGDHWVLDGVKTWISNGGVADQYIVIARTEDVAGAKGLSAIMVDAGTPGFYIDSRIDIISPHPLATIRFDGCRVPAGNLIGARGEGFKIAMSTLDIFRTSVGGAAVGVARRALNETIARVKSRKLFGQRMSDMDTVRMKVADMALEVDMAALIVYRAAWLKDTSSEQVTREVAMAKLGATEAAQRVVDAAVQLFGGMGVTSGTVIERLYRDVRPMRIYEGASEVQKLIIGRKTLS